VVLISLFVKTHKERF